MDVRLKFPFTACIAGPTRSGKTCFTKRLVKHANELITPPPEKIIWCYSEWQDGYNDLEDNPNLTMSEGLPDMKELSQSKNVRKLLILDDLMIDASKGNNLHSLFSRGSHHWNMGIVHIVQNLFYSNLRTAHINSHYLILMKNPSDQLQVQTLARQIFPSNRRFFTEAYRDACSEPYGYLLVDLEPTTPDTIRLRTCIFPDDPYNYVYQTKN
jgi:hypothetical protein